MKTIPFPLSVNIGTDIVHIPRIRRLITRSAKKDNHTWGSLADKFLRRIMDKQETQHFYSRFRYLNFQLPSQFATTPAQSLQSADLQRVDEMARWLAGRFAAKEAARKAAPGGAANVGWKDVVVRTGGERGGGGGVASERPEVVYLKDGGCVGEVGKLSISHDGEYVVATVLAAASAPASALENAPVGSAAGTRDSGSSDDLV